MKGIITISVFVFGLAFAYIPNLWGDNDFFSLSSLLLSMVGGLLGVYVGVVVSRRWLG